MRTAGLLALLSVLMLAGCFGATGLSAGEVVSAGETSSAADLPSQPVVVALIDSGINPYHEAFRAHGPDAVEMAAALGMEPAPAPSSWKGVEPFRLYAFPGTRVLALTAIEDGETGIQDVIGHGTATASLVAREAPDALIVMIQARAALCGEPGCLLHPSLAAAMQWAADEPRVDVISVSAGLPANVPSDGRAQSDVKAYVDASRLAHDRGKLLVASAGNDPTLTVTDFFDGPPWVISVGGYESSQQGEAPDASKGVDVVANFTEIVASASGSGDYRTRSGTSFAAPIVAATLAQALHDARNLLEPSEFVAHDLRAALNATAREVTVDAWNPANRSEDLAQALLTHSLPIVAAPAQLGWGKVDGDLAPLMVEWLLQEREQPASKADAAAFQSHRQQMREKYWSNH